MTPDPSFREQALAYFLEEAPELLHVLEQELLSLQEGYSINKVHNLMRVTHTLKGAAASVGLEGIKTVAHSLEDIFKSLCKPDVTIDSEIEALLFEGYECLRVPLMAEMTGQNVDDSEVFNACAAIFARLQEKLGDCFDSFAYIPTSTDLGFDLTQSIFEVGVTQRLDEMKRVISSGDEQAVASTLQTQAEVFLGLAESLNLPGVGAIANAAITALAKHPSQALSIAELALQDFKQSQAAVLSGDRTLGGEVSPALQQLALEAKEEASEAKEAEIDSFLETIWDLESENWSLDDQEETVVADQLLAPDSYDLTSFAAANADEQQTDAAQEEELSLSIVEGLDTIAHNPSTQISKQDSNSLADTVRVKVEHLEHLNYLLGELLTNQNRHSLLDENLHSEIQHLLTQFQQHQLTLSMLQDWFDRRRAEEAFSFPAPKTAPSLASRDPEAKMLQSLLKNAAQLEAATESIEALVRQASQILEHQHRLLTSARDDLLSARMVALGDIFNRLPRILEQLENLHSKPVALKLSGTDVLVDKAVAEKLYNPLLHLVRNAFDHGIEPVEVRRQRGKPEKGHIEIRAFHQGGHLMIQVQDDGQGLKFDQIRQKAIDLALVSPEKASSMSEAELMDLLFEPGLSTAQQVNNLSGRGIGLDVVRAQIQALQGAVTVYSEPNLGTTFLLQIPFSMTIAKLCLAQAGSTVYALLTDAIEQVLIPKSNQVRYSRGGKLLRWGKGADEQMLFVYELEQILNYLSPVTEAKINEHQDSQEVDTRMIILRSQDKLLALEVDQIIGDQEMVIRPLGPMIVPPRYVYGGSVLADGKLTLVIDGAALVQCVFEQQNLNATKRFGYRSDSHEAFASFTSPMLSSNFPNQLDTTLKTTSSRTLLLVDDSLTLRQSLSSTLQKCGYQVLEAGDGLEAIGQLRSQSDIQLVICDLEMPRMNGFEFLNQRRQDPHLAQIPVLILTSQKDEKYRLLAMELGASAYVDKADLDREFLITVAELIHASVI